MNIAHRLAQAAHLDDHTMDASPDGVRTVRTVRQLYVDPTIPRWPVVVDTLKALAQVNPVTAAIAGLADVVQSHKARKQLRLLIAVIEHHDQAIDDLRAAIVVSTNGYLRSSPLPWRPPRKHIPMTRS